MAKIDDLNKLREDAENHPERGKVDGRFVINERSEKLEITISRETYKRLLLNAASEGEAASTAAARLLKVGLGDERERGKVRDFLELKAAILDISIGQLTMKIFGQNKHKVRDRKLSRTKKSQSDDE